MSDIQDFNETVLDQYETRRKKALQKAREELNQDQYIHVGRRGEGSYKRTKALHKRLKRAGRLEELALIRATKRCMGKLFYTTTPKEQLDYIKDNQVQLKLVQKIFLDQLYKDKRRRDNRKAKKENNNV